MDWLMEVPSAAIPMSRAQQPRFEYACHEGNYGMEAMLRAARAADDVAKQGD